MDSPLVPTLLFGFLISTVIALPFPLTAGRHERVNETVRVAAGLVSIALGGSIMIKIGLIQGLFVAL
ncbi:MAG: hypothetical protein V3R69_05705 [candidate division NC10 bacterium]